MLVCELMEQLAEMPPELPVETSIWLHGRIGGEGAKRGGRLVGPCCVLFLDQDDLAESFSQLAETYLKPDG